MSLLLMVKYLNSLNKYSNRLLTAGRSSSRFDQFLTIDNLTNISLPIVPKHSTKLESSFLKTAIMTWGADANRVAISPTPNQTLLLRNHIEENFDLFDLNHSLRFLLKTFGVIGN